MYDGLYTSPVDIFPVTIPVLQSPPSQAIPLNQQHREFRGERLETIISSYTTSLYLKLINWNNIYLIKFPSSLLSIPSVIYKRSADDSGICINTDLSTAKMDVKTNNITMTDHTAFASCVLYGLNKILFNDMDDQQILSDAYHSLCGFVYSLIIRSYVKDFDLSDIMDQDIANAYYLVCKLVSSCYIRVSGNTNALATVTTQKFFLKEDPKTKKKVITARFNVDYLPKDKQISDYHSLFNALDDMDIFPGISLSDFRTRVSRYFSQTLLSAMGNGLDFVAMLASCKIPSEIFSQRILSVRPASINNLNKALHKYIMEYTNNNKQNNDSDIPPGWGV